MSDCCTNSGEMGVRLSVIVARVEYRDTHSSNRVEQTLFNQRVFQTRLSTSPTPFITSTHCGPCPVHPSATAAEEQVVIELVLLCCWATSAEQARRGTLDGHDDSAVILRCKDMAPETVRVGFPTMRKRLSKEVIRASFCEESC
jgi:hypothetical protein